jgi:hypothetical protein
MHSLDGWSRPAWYGAVLGACLAAALASTWPLAIHLASAVPLGTETAVTIPVFDVWTLWWSADRLLHGYAELWNAPIFHPVTGAFTFSEPLLLPGVLAAPLVAVHLAPALVHNLVLLGVLIASGLLGCRLARALGLARAPALLAAVLIVTLPFFAKMQGELPILAVAGALAALDGAVRFGANGRWRDALVFGLGLVAQWLSCQQLAAFAFLFAAAAAVVALRQRRFAPTALVRLGVAGAAAALVIYLSALVPIAVHRSMAFSRPTDLVESLSAGPGDFFTRPAGALLPPHEDPARFTGGLFPGWIVLGLAIAGARRPAPWRWYLVGAAAGGLLLALGLTIPAGPFALLRQLPGFAEIRSPFRAAVFLQLALVLLAARGLAAVKRARLVPAIALLGALENLSVPARLVAIPPPASWTAWLAAQPAGTVVAHVPFPGEGTVEALASESWRLLAQIQHHQPLVNGYASNFPALHREVMFAMGNTFPDHALGCALHTVLGAQLMLVDRDWLSAHAERFAALGPMYLPVHQDDAVAVFRLTPAPGECPPVRLDVGAPGP